MSVRHEKTCTIEGCCTDDSTAISIASDTASLSLLRVFMTYARRGAAGREEGEAGLSYLARGQQAAGSGQRSLQPMARPRAAQRAAPRRRPRGAP
jgi:hypothetical protein